MEGCVRIGREERASGEEGRGSASGSAASVGVSGVGSECRSREEGRELQGWVVGFSVGRNDDGGGDGE